jgi:hypothetical protein
MPTAPTASEKKANVKIYTHINLDTIRQAVDVLASTLA